MKHDWMLAVLEDLKTYAELNGLGKISGHLVDITKIAHQEVAAANSASGGWARNGTGLGMHSEGAGASRGA